MKKRIIISLSTVVVGVLLWLVVGHLTSRDTVTVRDADSGKPVKGAEVDAVYASLVGRYTTDKEGVARIDFGLPRGDVGYVEVYADGYERQYLFRVQSNHLELALKPIDKILATNTANKSPSDMPLP